MKPTAAAIGLVCALAAACRPNARGRCNVNADCRSGASCAVDRHICIAASGQCTPACGIGELCVDSACAIVSPTVSVTLATTTVLSPASPRVLVHVEAASVFALEQLSVEVDTDHAVATGTLAAVSAGDNYVSLGHFDATAAGPVSVFATLSFKSKEGASLTARSVAVPAAIDAQPPEVTVFVPAASDTVNGWVPRSAGTLEVRAQVDDGPAGSGPDSATLNFDPACPAAFPCVYPGTVLSRAGGVATFSFVVPRAVQQAGSEAKVAATVSARDKAGNEGIAAVSLLIDDAGPQIGPVTLISSGIAGEDRRTWFPGGANARDVEIAVKVADQGAGVAGLVLTLVSSEVVFGTALTPAPIQPVPADGTVHFKLPASGVQGREGALHFTLDARDGVGNASSLPASDATAIFVDAAPPTVSVARVRYDLAAPADACAPSSATFVCGRDGTVNGKTVPSHLLRDDTATVEFDAYDCGVGMAASGAVTVSSAGHTASGPAQSTATSGTHCTNGSPNPLHTYSFPLVLLQHAPILAAPDSLTGLVAVALGSQAPDRASNSCTGPDGSASVSLVRWRNQLSGQPATGAPGLLPAPAPAPAPAVGVARQIVVGTQGNAPVNPQTPNLFLVNPNGVIQWASAIVPAVTTDVAIDSTGQLSVVASNWACATGKTNCGWLSYVNGHTGALVSACNAAQGSAFGAPPALSGPVTVIAATARDSASMKNAFQFQAATSGGCSNLSSVVLTTGSASSGELTGVTADSGTLFFSHAAGFTSTPRSPFNQSWTSFDSGSLTNTPGSADPPSLSRSSTAVSNAIFGGNDPRVWNTTLHTSQCTGLSPCWASAPGYNGSGTIQALSTTPVFDGTNIYSVDAGGSFYTLDQATGASLPRTPIAPTVTPTKVSAPVLLKGGTAIVVQSQDGQVRLLTPASPAAQAVDVVQVGSFGSVLPLPPVVDARGNGGGVAYLVDSKGWLWAIQLDLAPLAASATVWPRPSRDSCNSRDAEAACP